MQGALQAENETTSYSSQDQRAFQKQVREHVSKMKF